MKTLFAAIVGLPNTGKSTLINRLTDSKIAITSPRPQTTRGRIMGVATVGETQYIYLDTPGFHAPRNKLGRHMMERVRESAAEADVALFVTWPKEHFDESEHALLAELKQAGMPVILAVNKSDTMRDKAKGPQILKSLAGGYDFMGAVLISALTGDGIKELMALLESRAVPGPLLFPEDTLTDQPERVIAAELIREKLLAHLRDELPHGCAVCVERFREREDSGLVDIEANILCEQNSHKGMIIGKNGAMLKTIGSEARADIEAMLDCRVNLQLWVKVREGWRDNEHILRELGY